jgi:hypothetical protein
LPRTSRPCRSTRRAPSSGRASTVASIIVQLTCGDAAGFARTVQAHQSGLITNYYDILSRRR